MKYIKNLKSGIFLLVFSIVLVNNAHAQEVWPLDKCIQTALENNKKLKLEKNNIEIGKEKKKQVKSNLLPKIKLVADYKYYIELPYQLMPMSVFGGPEGKFKEAQFGVPHNINANVQLAMPVYNPQIRSNVDVAKIGIQLAELKYQMSEEEIYFEISNLYYNAQILLSQLDFIESNIENSEKLKSTVELLKENQLAMGTDVDKIALQIMQLQTKKDLIKSKYDQVLNGMKILMGVPLDEKFDVTHDIEYKDESNYSVKTTLDIKLMETKDKLLRSQLKAIKKSELPSVMVYGSYGALGYGYDKSPNEFLNFYSMGFVGMKATYNLFDGRINKKKKNIKKKEIENNALQLALLKDQNNMKLKNAQLRLSVARRSVETNKSQIEFAKNIYDKTVLQQKQGLASVNDVLMADSAVRQAQQNYLSAIIEYLKADLELKKLSGNILK